MTVESAAGVLAAALTLAACGGGQPGQTQAPPAAKAATATAAPAVAIDACALLEKPEIEAALGRSVGAPTPENIPPVYGCRWPADALDGLSVSVIAYDDAAQALAAHELAIKINNYEQVAGVGERAYSSPFNEITALAGRHELSVNVTLSQVDRSAIARSLAQKALARLPR